MTHHISISEIPWDSHLIVRSLNRKERTRKIIIFVTLLFVTVFIVSQAICLSALSDFALWINKSRVDTEIQNYFQNDHPTKFNVITNSSNNDGYPIESPKLILPASKYVVADSVVTLNNGKNPPVKTNERNLGSNIKQLGVSHEVDQSEISLNGSQIETIRIQINNANFEQRIYNAELFEPFNNQTVIIIIQVHNRPENLQLLIESLEASKYINESVVIFSHDVWSDQINEIISKVQKFRYMQMFFPFSVQTHPHIFPGIDPRDCAWNHVRNSIGKKACLNEDWPDTYNHYREPRYTQIKHHWWWKINRVFDHLRITKYWTGDLLFLEEDEYVYPDILHVLTLMRSWSRKTKSHVLKVGNNVNIQLPTDADKIVEDDWTNNIGFALNRTTWQLIKKQSEFFCTYDDYNWDWTLRKLMQQDGELRGSMLATKFSRVVHLGKSGIHTHKTDWTVSDIAAVREIVSKASSVLFPSTLKMVGWASKPYRSPALMNGGFKDWRDTQLCHAISNGTASEEFLAKLQFRDLVL